MRRNIQWYRHTRGPLWRKGFCSKATLLFFLFVTTGCLGPAPTELAVKLEPISPPYVPPKQMLPGTVVVDLDSFGEAKVKGPVFGPGYGQYAYTVDCQAGFVKSIMNFARNYFENAFAKTSVEKDIKSDYSLQVKIFIKELRWYEGHTRLSCIINGTAKLRSQDGSILIEVATFGKKSSSETYVSSEQKLLSNLESMINDAIQNTTNDALTQTFEKMVSSEKVLIYAKQIKAKSPPNYAESSAIADQYKPPKTVLVASKPSKPETHSRVMDLQKQHWAIVVGLSDYADSRVPRLRYAGADAKSFYDWIVSPNGGRYAPDRVKLLLNEQVTAANIRDALFDWSRQALEEDILTIFFAGHGSPESPDSPANLFLLPYDVDYGRIAATGFPMWDIETALRRYIKAKKVIIVADACHSGGIGAEFSIARRGVVIKPGLTSTGLQKLSKVTDGIAVLTASGADQLSQEGKQWGGGHGVFSYYLLKGLKGEADYNKDKSVTLGELIPYLSEKVRRATKNAQCPEVAGKFDPAMTLGK